MLKTSSCQSLLQSIGTRFRINNNNWHSDAIEWMGEAIRAVGYHTGFEKKDKDLKVKNYRVEVPGDLETLNYIYYNGIPLVIANDRQDLLLPSVKSNLQVTTYQDTLDLNKQVDRLEALKIIYAATPTPATLTLINDVTNKITALISNIRLGANSDLYHGDYYSIDGGYFKTSFASGIITAFYNGYSLDASGYPLIVDTFKYRMTVEWYVMAQLCLQGYSHHEINYRLADAKYEDYRQQASNEAKVFGVDKMERFYERWSSIKRDLQGVHVYDAL